MSTETQQQSCTTAVSMRMAKATPADVNAAISIACIIEGLHKGYYPSAEDGAPTWFDEDDAEHLRFLFDTLMHLSRPVGGGLSRVAGGMHTILHNDILDPDDDCLALHPRLSTPSGRVLTCVYCGHEYPQDTPAAGDAVLTEHIRACEKHPLRDALQKQARVRAALAGLVGVDGKESLLQLRGVVSVLPGDESDRGVTLNAIDALLDTCEAAREEAIDG